MNGYSHAHCHWNCGFPCLFTLPEMGLLLLCAAPYNLLICAWVRWHPVSSRVHPELWVLLPLHPILSACQLERSLLSAWDGEDALSGLDRVTIAARRLLPATDTVWLLLWVLSHSQVSPHSHKFSCLLYILSSWLLFLKAQMTSWLLFHPSDSCPMKLDHCSFPV